MKVAMLQFLLPLCFILFVLNTQPLVVAAASEPVFDIHGQPLQPRVGYHVVRPLWADNEGLALGHTTNHTCPLDVILDPNSIAWRVYFSAPGLDYIPTLTDLTIDMHILGGECPEFPKVWKIRPIGAPGSYFFFVSTNGEPGGPYSKFKIERLQGEHSYEIYSFKYCPTESYKTICKPVGTYVDADGTKVMAIGDGIEPYYVSFQKASTYPQEKKNRDFSIV